MTTQDEGDSSRRPEPDPAEQSPEPPADSPATAEPDAGQEPSPEPPPVPSVIRVLPVTLEPPVRMPESAPHPTRRWFLAGTGAVLIGGGAGVAAALARHRPTPPPKPPPRALVEALAAERSLLAAVEAAGRGDASLAPRLRQLRRDHQDHLVAVHAALADYDQPEPAGQGSSSAPRPNGSTSPSTPRSVSPAQLRAAEERASREAADRADRLAGRNATLLASIAACEATHVELLK